MSRLLDNLPSRLPDPLRQAVQGALDAPSWIQVRRALAAFDQCPVETQGPEAVIQVLSTFTVKSIEPALYLGLRCIPCRPQFHYAPLNTIDQQLLDLRSALYVEHCLAGVILWRLDELLPELFHPYSAGGPVELKRKIQELISRMEKVVTTYLESGSNPLFLSTVLAPPPSGNAILDAELGHGISSAIAQINARILQWGSQESKLKVLDLHRWSAHEGAGYYDQQMDFMSRQPFTVRAAISLGLFLARNLRPFMAPRKKVLAVDLDNTLWGGILGEDGPGQLKLGHDFPGNIFLRLQREVIELKRQGVLLVLASKNEETEVRRVLDTLPGMLLKSTDFVCLKVNFSHKYLNLREAAAELGVGIDSFAFLDDSDYERAQMKTFNPEVLVLNERGDALHMLASLLQTDAFDTHAITQEDRLRHADYERRALRNVSSNGGNAEEFLASLQSHATLEPVGKGNLERVVQMLGKTNQFNLTTRRHRLEDVKDFLALPGCVALTVRLRDKFGDQGIVGALLAVPTANARILHVDSFLMSCRVLGRGVEDVLWAGLLNRAAGAGVLQILGDYIPTAKNGLVSELYSRFGLRQIEKSEEITRFVLEPVKPVPFPTWMAVEDLNL